MNCPNPATEVCGRQPPSGIRLRTARIEDAPAIAHLWRESILRTCAEAYRFHPNYWRNWADSKTEETVRALIESEQWFIAAEWKHVVSGFFCATFELGTFALFVAPDAQGHGIGQRLFSCYERVARECGQKRLSFRSSLNAVSFYRLCGCKENGASDGLTIPMQKELE